MMQRADVGRVGVRRPRAVALALLAAVTLGGCVDVTAEDAMPVDRERLDEVLADPWLAPVADRIARAAVGTNRGYRAGTAWSGREVSGATDAVGRMELAAATEVGWWVTYGRCPLAGDPPDLGPDKPDEPRPPPPEPDAVVVHLARDLADGSFAQAVLQLQVEPPDPTPTPAPTLDPVEEAPAAAPRTRVRVATYVANHLQPAAPRPREVDVTTLVCLAPPGTAGAVPGPVGEPELVNRAGRQPREDR